MIYTKKDFARDLRNQLALGYYPEKIGDWVYDIYSDYAGKIDNELEDTMMSLFYLELGPEFEPPESEIWELIRKLEEE